MYKSWRSFSLLLAALLVAWPVVSRAAEPSQVSVSIPDADEPASSTSDAAATLQPFERPRDLRRGGDLQPWQDVLAQAVVDPQDYSQQDRASPADQAAWQWGQAAQQAVPVPTALQQMVAQQLHQAPASGATGQKGVVAHTAEQHTAEQYDQEQPPMPATSVDATSATEVAATLEADMTEYAGAAEAEADRRAQRRAEAARRARLQAAEEELEEAEDLLGWAANEAGVDVPRGIARLEALFARLDAIIDAPMAGGSRQRQPFHLPHPPEEQTQQQLAAGSDLSGAANAKSDSDSAASAEQGGSESNGIPEAEDGGDSDSIAEAADGSDSTDAADAEGVRDDASAGEVGAGREAHTAEWAAGKTGEGVQADVSASSRGDAGAGTAEAGTTAAASELNQTQHMQPGGSESAPDIDFYEHPELAPLSDAAVTLAALLSSGIAAAHGLPRNDSRAVHVLRCAAMAGSLEARLALADRYISGRGVPRLPHQGLQHAKLAGPELLAQLDEAGAVSSNDGTALRSQFIDASYQPAGAGWDDANTLQYERSLAERGDVEAHRQLGYRLLTGQGMARDLPAAFRQFQAAAAGGDPYAQFNLGFMHIRGMHVPRNYSAARHHFLQAAEKHLPAAVNGLGVLHFHGQGVPVNHSEAARYFAMAADRDHDAAFNLAVMYQGGYGVQRNISKAIELLQNSTGMGSWRAPHQLFLVFADGLHGAPRDASQAAVAFWRFMSLTSGWRDGGKQSAERYAEGDAWGAALRYSLLAEQGDPSAMLNLAWLLHRGRVHAGPDRHALALPLWLRAGERNCSEGALLAGHAYSEGSRLGLPGGTNLTAAVAQYRRAAAAGNVEGLFSLGRMLELGRGLPRNASEAARLYRQAIAAAPREAYALAPFLALQWLRLRVLLAPLLRLTELALLAGGNVAGSGRIGGRRGPAAPGVGSGAAQGPGQQLVQRSPGLPQWDTLLIAAMVGALTWVLWRKRKLQQRVEVATGRRAAPQGLLHQENDHLAVRRPVVVAGRQQGQRQSEEPQT